MGKNKIANSPLQWAVIRTVEQGEGDSHFHFPLIVGHINGCAVSNVAAVAAKCGALNPRVIQIWIVNTRIIHHIVR